MRASLLAGAVAAVLPVVSGYGASSHLRFLLGILAASGREKNEAHVAGKHFPMGTADDGLKLRWERVPICVTICLPSFSPCELMSLTTAY